MIANQEEAEELAIEALGFIAQDNELTGRFLALTGLAGDDIRQAVATPGFQAGVLEFLLSHEPTLLAFCSAALKDPQQVAQAFALLPGGKHIER
ncbi:MAG: Hypothetical protein BHV28_06020 [Candidatus Tokpelaia hoelldobleri]|uniref:DUF3572 domain-containing protein n=1 Tax=Candidatus Tokpelaia hoelldobleri TaxID=1902579 RepID=A0A1U9JTX2_9HYPH|nr:MAG: Hypothetical protein BHV28_06020 [Candidatus Tokpelaia hoelldoblerii]